MSHHHTACAFSKQFAKGVKFDAIKPFSVMENGGEGFVRIRIGIAVAGEVLYVGEHSMVLQSGHIGVAHARYMFTIFTKRSVPDDGVQRIGVHIHHR